MADEVLRTISDGVAEVVLNRPDKLNAVDDALVAGLHAALDDISGSGARAVILRGEGRAFCAGRDLAGADPMNEDGEALLTDVYNPLVELVADLPVPTFAAVHGATLGTGFGLAFACDVVIAGESTKVGSPFANIGAVLDGGAHHVLVRRLGAHRALELIYTGRLMGGAEAAELGLVNRCVPDEELLDTVRSMAATVAAGPTLAFAASKRIVRMIEDEQLGYRQVLGAEAIAQGQASRTEDYAEGMTAFVEKRRPTFRGA